MHVVATHDKRNTYKQTRRYLDLREELPEFLAPNGEPGEIAHVPVVREVDVEGSIGI